MPSSKVILSSLLLLSGCVATQRDVMDISNQMDNLGNQISNMEKNQADLALKMDELNQSLSHFSENLRDYQNQSSRMSAKLDDLESTLGRKIDSTGEVIKTQQEEIKKKQQEIESLVLPTKTYQEAYHNLTQKKYDLAVHGFQLYLEKFPKGEWGDKAYYYMGEALSAKGE
ncbi:MAG: hypothetical protein HY399_08975, partial [Elusimicrobia bacterium]|nr:hypothetical protein [Elusimicrobiota bacterium]